MERPKTGGDGAGAPARSGAGRVLAAAHVLFFLSGASALVYEVAWVRALSLVFGGSHLAVATVVSIFMLGLALGSVVAGRRLPKGADPLRLYGLAELGVAGAALLFWVASRYYPAAYVPLARLAPDAPAWLTAVRVALAAAGMLPATILMGTTLPLMSAFAADRADEVGSRLSLLYGVNTVGAVAGAVLTGFVALPVAGIGTTVAAAVATSAAVGLGALALSRAAPSRGARPADAPSGAAAGPGPAPRIARALLWAAALSGFCALGYEVLWTRVLILGVGATDYGFTAVLASFLACIGIGGAAYHLVARSPRLASDEGRLRALGAAQLAIALAIGVSLVTMEGMAGRWVTLQRTFEAVLEPFAARQASSVALVLSYLGPAALLMGIAFPLAGDAYARARGTTAEAVGSVTAANTLGAIAGSAAGGHVLVLAFGIERSIQLLVVVNAGLGLWLLATAAPGERLRRAAVALAIAAAAILVAREDGFRAWDRNYFAVYRSIRPEALATPALREAALRRAEVAYLAEGASSIVCAVRTGDQLAFATNGRVEASTGARDVQNQYALGHLPMLLHPDPRRVLVVGAGAGMTAGATTVHPGVEQVTLVELEPKVLGVVRAFAAWNHDLLSSPRLRVVLNDGRNHLLTTQDRYDVITADPIHPWFRGAGYLYTVEYFRLAASRLTPGGVMAQWLPLYQMTPDHTRSVAASFAGAFPHVQAWLVHSDVVLIGSDAPIVLDEAALARRLGDPVVGRDMAMAWMGTPRDLFSYFALGTAGVRRFASGGRVNTDDNLYLEFSSPHAIGREITEPANIGLISASREPLAPYARFIDGASRARWEAFERSGVPPMIDRAQILAIAGAWQAPEFGVLAGVLDREAAGLARWRLLAADRPAAR
jgi:spermidine synthase